MAERLGGGGELRTARGVCSEEEWAATALVEMIDE